MKNCENCGNFDRTNNKGTEACGDCITVEPSSWKPVQTNADRIRAMSDDELLEFLYAYQFCDICNEGCNECRYNGDCKRRLKDWLKQPAEV